MVIPLQEAIIQLLSFKTWYRKPAVILFISPIYIHKFWLYSEKRNTPIA